MTLSWYLATDFTGIISLSLSLSLAACYPPPILSCFPFCHFNSTLFLFSPLTTFDFSSRCTFSSSVWLTLFFIFVCLFVCLFGCLSVCLSVWLFVWLCFFVSLLSMYEWVYFFIFSLYFFFSLSLSFSLSYSLISCPFRAFIWHFISFNSLFNLTWSNIFPLKSKFLLTLHFPLIYNHSLRLSSYFLLFSSISLHSLYSNFFFFLSFLLSSSHSFINSLISSFPTLYIFRSSLLLFISSFLSPKKSGGREENYMKDKNRI